MVTVCLNSEKTIKNCLRSSADLEGVEHIFVDGRSHDQTIEIIELLQKERSNILLVQEITPRGIYSALNFGMALATGKYVLILNSDDELVDFENLVNDIKSRDADIVIGRQLGSIGDKNIVSIGFEEVKYGPIMKMPWPHGAMIAKKDFFDRVGNYSTDYRLSSDLDWVNKALLAYPTIEYLDYYISKFRFGGVSTTRLSGPIESFKIFRFYGGSYLIGSLNLLKALTIKIVAKVIGWEKVFSIKKILKLGTGIWQS